MKVYANVTSPFAPLKLLNDPRNSNVGSNGGDGNPPYWKCQPKSSAREYFYQKTYIDITVAKEIQMYVDNPITHMTQS